MLRHPRYNSPVRRHNNVRYFERGISESLRAGSNFIIIGSRGIDNAISIHWVYGPCIKVSADGEKSVKRGRYAVARTKRDFTAVLITGLCY